MADHVTQALFLAVLACLELGKRLDRTVGALLERFDPVQFEQRLAPATVMEKMAGGASRKAKMWDQMVEVHTQVAREVDGTQGLFGDTFSSAYQAQIDRLSRGDN